MINLAPGFACHLTYCADRTKHAHRISRGAVSELNSGGQRPNFWTTLPGILTGVAALITAIVALIGALNLLGVGSGDEQVGSTEAQTTETSRTSEPSPTSPTSPSASTTRKTPPPTSPPTPPPGTVKDGLTAFGDEKSSYFDLDMFVVHGTAALSADISVDFATRDVWIGAFGSSAFAASTPVPDLDSCISALASEQTRGFHATDSDVGDWYCVQTSSGNVAAFMIHQFSPLPRQLSLYAYTWEL